MNCPSSKCQAENGVVKMYMHGTVALVKRGIVPRYRCPKCGKTATEKKGDK